MYNCVFCWLAYFELGVSFQHFLDPELNNLLRTFFKMPGGNCDLTEPENMSLAAKEATSVGYIEDQALMEGRGIYYGYLLHNGSVVKTTSVRILHRIWLSGS